VTDRGHFPRSAGTQGVPPTRQAYNPAMFDRLAPMIFVLIWSSSFIATRAGLRDLSPLWFIAVRMTICAAVLAAVVVLAGRASKLTAMAWLHSAVAGVLTQAVMLSTAHVAMTRIQAAPVALIQTLHPLMTAVLAWPLLGERLRAPQWIGLALGTAGVLLAAGLTALRSQAELDGVLLITAGVTAMTCGTLYYRRYCRDVPVLEGTAAQFIASSIACLLAASLLETPRLTMSTSAIASIAWNAGPVSLGGMALYFLMLRRGAAARVTANFYLVPGIASLLAWALLNEALSPLTIAGLVVSSIGCWLVGRRPGLGARAG